MTETNAYDNAYDKASWHLEGEHWPEGLPEAAAFTHLGFYWNWLTETGLVSEKFGSATPVDRNNAPSHLTQTHEGLLTEDMLTETGNAFTSAYYDQYMDDIATLAMDAFQDDDITPYELPDDWEVYDAVKIILDARFEDWKEDPDADFPPLELSDEDEE